jgi:hypothetical protein
MAKLSDQSLQIKWPNLIVCDDHDLCMRRRLGHPPRMQQARRNIDHVTAFTEFY